MTAQCRRTGDRQLCASEVPARRPRHRRIALGREFGRMTNFPNRGLNEALVAGRLGFPCVNLAAFSSASLSIEIVRLKRLPDFDPIEHLT